MGTGRDVGPNFHRPRGLNRSGGEGEGKTVRAGNLTIHIYFRFFGPSIHPDLKYAR